MLDECDMEEVVVDVDGLSGSCSLKTLLTLATGDCEVVSGDDVTLPAGEW